MLTLLSAAGSAAGTTGDTAPAPQRLAVAVEGTLGVATGARSTLGSAEAVRVSAGRPSSGAVALTFDDGYSRSACAAISSTLRSFGVTGTFFVNGLHVAEAPSRWRTILRGHELGNHTRSHRRLTIESDAVVRQQIYQNEGLQERIVGQPMLKLLRPPYGAHDRRVRRLAGELGYLYTVLWSVDSRDWQRSATVRSIIGRATGAPPGSIILMHCGPRETPQALPAIIRHYRSRGIRLVGLATMLGLPPATRPSSGAESSR